MKVLLIQTAFIGDVILATALLEKLHHHYPTAQIDILVRKGNESLLNNHPFVSEVLIWDKSKKYKSLWSLIWYVRGNYYDKVICLQRFATMGLLTALSGATEKIGFNKNPFAVTFTHKVEHEIGTGIHEVERNIRLISWFTDNTVFRPKLYIDSIVLPNHLGTQTQPYICLAPTSVWFTKQFPESKWIELIDALPSTYHIYLLGAKSDWDACQRIRNNHNHVENLAGKINLLQSAALMQKAAMNYVNDSAPMHLCSAVNAKVCAIFCSTIPAFGFGPLSDISNIVEVSNSLSCRPCGLHGKKKCPKNHFKCGFDISKNQLLAILSS
jgi:ADP-heptose:LPS heptosyltransferase